MKSKFDLFPCSHHGHRVTSYECQRYYEVSRCPADCAKHAALVSVDWDTSAPEIAWIFRERRPARAFEVVPVFERRLLRVLSERPLVAPVIVYDEMVDGLTPIIGTTGRMGIYFEVRLGQVVRRCSDCGKIKSRNGFSPSAQCRYGIFGVCKECRRIRRQKGDKKVIKNGDKI
ncbi:MAG: hypothetical protein C4518_08625 [Desulfobacteraceae bacterium]|nr:MAG: hypothetical protein C4518_08625 [Desulfobacteraceae bacterium]